MNNFNTIVIYTVIAEDAERVLKTAEQVMRQYWNLYGFQRLGSGYTTIVTDGYGNPYGQERELKVFGIAIKVPEHMDYRTALTYLDCGRTKANVYSDHYLYNT